MALIRVRTLRIRLLGVAALAGIVGMVALSIAFYTKSFSSFDKVTVLAGTAGQELDVPADVKVRGVEVGTVTKISTTGGEVHLQLSLDKSKRTLIPYNVDAQIIPKTLFGEKYVNLVIPSADTPSTRPIAVGATITQSSNSLEVEQVFNDLVPLLQTLQPVALNMTLSNLADALQGRGNQLGQNLARTDVYFSGLNPDLGNIETDISRLSTFSTDLDTAAPHLLATARQFSFNARTLVAKDASFDSFLVGTHSFAQVATAIVAQNASNLVELAQVSEPTLDLLARYSPEYPCLLQGLTESESTLGATFAPTNGTGAGLHIDLQVISTQPAGYSYPSDAPDYKLANSATFAGPHCYGLPGTPSTAVGSPPPTNGPQSQTAATEPSGESPGDLARILAAPQLGVANNAVPDIDALLIGPQLAGMKVSLG